LNASIKTEFFPFKPSFFLSSTFVAGGGFFGGGGGLRAKYSMFGFFVEFFSVFCFFCDGLSSCLCKPTPIFRLFDGPWVCFRFSPWVTPDLLSFFLWLIISQTSDGRPDPMFLLFFPFPFLLDERGGGNPTFPVPS